MRTTEERLMLIESRKKSIVEHKKKVRRAAVNVLSSAACLLLAVFIGVYVSSLGVSSMPVYLPINWVMLYPMRPAAGGARAAAAFWLSPESITGSVKIDTSVFLQGML